MMSFLQSYFKRFFHLSLIFSAVFFAQTTFAQVKFSVVCPNKKIGKEDVLQIQFKIQNASSVDNITPPAFNNFSIVSGPNQESSESNINGKISQYVALGFSLKANATGTFTIGSATAIADGKTYKTDPINIQVVNGSVVQSQPNNTQNSSPVPNLNFDFPPAPVTHQFDDYILKPGENVEEKAAKNIFLKLDVTKTSCFVGSPLVATYKLYTRLPSETTITNAPSFDGFSVNDLDVNSNSSLEKYNGRLYNVYTIRKVELYPLQPGDFTLDPVIATNQITFVKSQYLNSRGGDLFDMFQNFGSGAIPAEGQVVKNITLQSAPLVIHVKPLPQESKPGNFRGAVGDFTITATLTKNNFTTDDAGTLKVTITGKGNIQLINAPEIKWPQGIDGYDAKVSDNVDKTKVPMEGSKTFSYPFTISKPGNYTIDSISFPFFDPATATYKTMKTGSFAVKVTKGKGISNNPFANSSARSNAEKNGLISETTEWIGGIALFCLIIYFTIFFLIKKNKKEDDLEKDVKLDDLKNEIDIPKKEFKIPQNPLTAAHEKMVQQNSKEFYQTLDASLKNYLAVKLNVPPTELSKKRLNEELDKCNVSLGTSLMLTSLLNEVELNLYSPTSNMLELNNVFDKASEVVSLLDKQVCS